MSIVTRKIIIFSLILIFFILVSPGLAEIDEKPPTLLNAGEGTAALAEKAGYPETPRAPEQVVGRIIAYVMGFLGVVFFVLMVYGGWLWLTAAGNEEQLKKAKNLIKHAIIGLIIVFAAYAISYFVVSRILTSIVAPEAPE